MCKQILKVSSLAEWHAYSTTLKLLYSENQMTGFQSWVIFYGTPAVLLNTHIYKSPLLKNRQGSISLILRIGYESC